MLLTSLERDTCAEANYPLVFYVVKMFQNSGVSYDELVSIAIVGYAKALKAFDNERNVKFSTYAINCIRNEILFFLRKEKGFMRNNVSMNTVLSIDKNGNDLSLEDVIGNEILNESGLEDSFMMSEDIEILKKALQYLSPKEQYIVTYRFGLDRGIIKTQKEIAMKINMSQANVSKLEKNILDKIQGILVERFDWKN